MLNDKYLTVAKQAAKEADKIFVKYFGNAGKVSVKNGDPRNMVTEIDLKIERLIRQIILKNFPEAKIIGEEFGSSKIEKNDIVWIIDPIDGTTNFIRGIPFTCITIGVWDKNGPLLGVVSNPVLKQTYTALRGKGAFLNGKKISPSKVSGLDAASGAIGWLTPKNAEKIFSQAITFSRKLRVLASSAWQTCMVASGQLDYYATHDVHIWDVAGPLAILKEAGGKFSDFKGKALTINLLEIIASNGKIHKELVKKLS